MMQAIAPVQFSSSIFTCKAQKPKQNAKTKQTQKANKNVNKASVKSVALGFGNGRKEATWKCVEGCGACCKLDKGPAFATPDEIFDDPSDVQLYQSLIGPDGWCIHFEKSSRKCSIYSERPYFCRVEPKVFESLYGIKKKKFNREACNCCRDTIKAIYGSDSKELQNFNAAIKNSNPS